MRIVWGAVLGACIAAATTTAARADADIVIRAGEWQTSVTMNGRPGASQPGGNARVHLVCHPVDRVMNAATLQSMMGHMGTRCTVPEMTSSFGTVTYSVACDVAGGHMTMHGTATPMGPDAVSMHSTSHMEGGSFAMPDMDMISVSRRLGPCQPGDTPEPNFGGAAGHQPG